MPESYMQQIVKYIKKNISKGYTLESLKWALTNQGYSRAEIDKAVKIANEELSKEAPKFIEKPEIKIETSPPIEEKTFLQKIKGWFS